jgi:RNA polymerase sigma-70 factor (ECF subfamily)
MDIGEHLFRRESGRMVAALTRLFGVHNLGLAEDVVQDAFCRALEVWKFRGVPENPSAWLMAAAKNRALDILRRERTARRFAPELGRLAERHSTVDPVFEEGFEPGAIRDDELRMMFSCCDPALAEEVQVALILNIMCGFGVGEISAAFMCSRAAIEKRLSRGKKVLADSAHLFDIDGADDLASRLRSVQRAIYLLFNEGYHGSSPEAAVRVELCEEAMRLGAILRENASASTPETQALSALMCLNAARLPGRIDESGNLNTLFEQDRSRWNAGLIAEGHRLLNRSAVGNTLSEYHIEGAIAGVHAIASKPEQTDWATIVELYNKLLEKRPSPVVSLNRAIAVAEWKGAEHGLEQIREIEEVERLRDYVFYWAALGELELRCGRPVVAKQHFETAVSLARNNLERQFLGKRVDACQATA